MKNFGGSLGASGFVLNPTAEKKAVEGSRNGDESLKGSCGVVQIVLAGQVDKHQESPILRDTPAIVDENLWK